MKTIEIETKLDEFINSIHKQIWQFEKDNKCSLEKFSIYRDKSKETGNGNKCYSTRSLIEYE